MLMNPDAIDQSWGYADPKEAFAAGIRVVSMYLSHDPSKDVNASKVKAYHAAGIAVLLNWEAVAGAPLNGAAQGQGDAAEAVRQARALIAAVGYRPANQLAIIFSCDRDTNPGNYPAIDAYYNATKNVTHAAGHLNGVYGEADLIDHLHSKGLTDVEWQTYAWSGGRLSPEADFYQFLNGQKLGGASVDFDKVEHAAALGAWWPPNHPLNTGDDPLADLTPAQLSQIAAAVWAFEIPNKTDATGKPVSTAHASQFFTWLVKTEQAQSQMAAAVKAAVAQLGVAGVDPDALAQAVVAHLGIDVVAK